MRNAFIHPVSTLAQATLALIGLHAWFAPGDDKVVMLGLILVHAYACNLLFLAWFLASPARKAFDRLKRVTEDPLGLFVMAMPSTLMNACAIAALVILLDGPTRAAGALACAANCAIVVLGAMPLRTEASAERMRERLRGLFSPLA